MAVHLFINKEHIEGEKESILHSIPCKIHSDDSANVSKFFTPYIRTNDNTNYDASLRGYPLHGQTLKVPKGYKGITFYEKKKPENPEHDRKLQSTGKFSKFTYWNYDKFPSKNDAFISALEWIDIAEALHDTSDDTL
ncbi:hypothetical protein PV327_008363 [Microctonus hyperodae]|uniref:Uncharacterized protein n=1 Tax=Microctonus hyperodae TaxID=165561 RepID=A0AA39F2Z0_MICHY|nr:hypothetical protein PV327_008363 [Microctonus hyperodae]